MVQNDLSKIDWTQKGKDNLTKDERAALMELRNAKNIIFKKSDKGGNVVLMDNKLYETEAKRLLGDSLTYRRLDHDPFPNMVQKLNGILLEVKEAAILSQRECDHLFVKEFNIPTFYIIPILYTNVLKNHQVG